MLIEIDSLTYSKYFPSDPHPFISGPFVELNKNKVEKIVRLVEDIDNPAIGLIAGVENGIIKSPFSAPFGGFHFRKEIIYISEIDNYFSLLKEYIASKGLKEIEITLPPDIYHLTFNSKVVNSLIRSGFNSKIPEITNWINLEQFKNAFSRKNSRKYYQQALRNELVWDQTTEIEEKKEAYELIRHNRERFGRPIFMTFKDIEDTAKLWPTDYFKVTTNNGTLLASAIFYRSHPNICYGVLWGDNDSGRLLRAMDFLAFNLWRFYKDLGYKYIDLGISTELGLPNEGLLRFKESHEATSSLRFRFCWKSEFDKNHKC